MLPFVPTRCNRECGGECGVNLVACHVYRDMPAELQKICQANLHLLQYLHSMPLDEIGIPQYYDKLNQGMKGVKNRNLLYPVNEQVYIHILANPNDIRDHYIPVEPCIFDEMEGKMEELEHRLIKHLAELEGIGSDEEALEIILNIVEKLVDVHRGRPESRPPTDAAKEKSEGKNNLLANLGNKKAAAAVKETISLSLIEYQSLRYLLKRRLVGMGPLQPMIWDGYLEDISCSGLGNIFVEHKIFGGLTTAIGFKEHEALDKFVIQLSESIKSPVTFRTPIVDATLPDNSRINICLGASGVSKRGSNFSIRKFTPVPISIIELIRFGSLSYEMAAYLSLVIQEGMNIFVAGESASGKTTLLNALCAFVPPESKIVSIEDTPEVQVPHPNWIRGVTRESGNNDASAVSMFALLKSALRQRPNLIIIGEIRGEEGAIAFQAMQTGHAVMSTFHAATVTKLIQRISGDPINVPKAYVDNLNLDIITQAVRLPNGSYGRRVTSINEIVGYDSSEDSFSFMAVFIWNPVNDTFDFKGMNNSFLLEEKIAPARGIPYDKRRQIYTQIKQRAEVLRKMGEQKISDFYELYTMLGRAYREDYFR